jgi:hypothetical protein
MYCLGFRNSWNVYTNAFLTLLLNLNQELQLYPLSEEVTYISYIVSHFHVMKNIVTGDKIFCPQGISLYSKWDTVKEP